MGTTFTVKAFLAETVLDFKNKVQDHQGIPSDEQRLIFGGTQLEDGRILRDCHIRNGCTLHLVLKLRGGKPVILLYPPAPLDATVALELSPVWSFSALYPKPASTNLQQAVSDPEVSLLIAPFESHRT